eukprot:g30161.t2
MHQNGFTSIFQRDSAGWLPLHYACLSGSAQVLQGLALRANPNLKTTKDQPLVGLPQFTSALAICVYFRQYEATQLLISAKASLTGGRVSLCTPLIAAALADSAEGIRTLCEARCSLHHRNLLGANAFDTACAHGTIQAVEEFLQQAGGDGIDMTCALHCAMIHGGSAELVQRLVDFRADVNDQSFTWWGRDRLGAAGMEFWAQRTKAHNYFLYYDNGKSAVKIPAQGSEDIAPTSVHVLYPPNNFKARACTVKRVKSAKQKGLQDL